MNWSCNNCGKLNESNAKVCKQCHTDRELSLAVTNRRKRRRMCPVCFHRHEYGVFCHVFCQGVINDSNHELESEFYIPDDDEDDSDDDNASFISLDSKLSKGNIKDISKLLEEAGKKKQEKMAIKPLSNPTYITPLRYVRCNCREGVPIKSSSYEPVSNPMKIGNIHIMTYERILASVDEELRKFSSYDEKLEFQQKRRVEIQQQLIPFIPEILSYLRVPECCYAPIVNTHWNLGTQAYRDYIDLRDCIPTFVYKLHNHMVENIFLYDHIAFSCGDRRIYATDYRTGTKLATIANTSGEIPALTQFQDELYYSDVNGAIRTSMISYDPSTMIPGKTLWDHTRSVTKIMWNLPSIGVCAMHGIVDHVCEMFTCSEDRCLRIWNTTTYKCMKIVDTKTLRTSSFLSMIQSGRHLFVGTTTAKIAVFSKHNVCEREDIHSCNQPGAEKSFCLQITLKLPDIKHPSGNPPGITHLLCAGPNYEFSTLWAGDTLGKLTLWKVPLIGLEFIPYKTWKGHEGAIRGLTNTWRHAISIGDDGKLCFYDLLTLDRMRQIDILEWCIYRGLVERPNMPRKLKSIFVQEDFQKGGTILVGTSCGEIVVMNMGTKV